MTPSHPRAILMSSCRGGHHERDAGRVPERTNPSLKIEIYEVLGSEAQESSNAWNNAGTGHATPCELNYTPK